MKRILIVEDDEKLNHGIKLALRNEYTCMQTFSIQSARDVYRTNQIDLILLDMNLPDGNGIDFLTEIRQTSQVPVIMLTVNKMEMDIVTGLESGANDYITKPFSLMVLRARVGVQLREKNRSEQRLRIGDYYFDFEKMEFWNGNRALDLSKTEQRLLHCLIENRGRNVSRSQLIDTVWQGDTEFVDEHALTVAVNRLRNKLRKHSSHSDNQECIKTVYGIGYTWVV